VEKPLVNKKYLLEKIPGKGGWTFARIPEIKPDKKKYFNWVKVKGSIDGYPIKNYNLMPMGNGLLFLPVKAEIRKKIKKEVGDYVTVKLFADNDPLETPKEFLDCLNEDSNAILFYKSLAESEQKLYINWIYSSKKEETKINRMALAINALSKNQKFNKSDTKI
jgi:hypothetical protein